MISCGLRDISVRESGLGIRHSFRSAGGGVQFAVSVQGIWSRLIS